MVFEKSAEMVVGRSIFQSRGGRDELRRLCQEALNELPKHKPIRVFANDARNDILLLLGALDEIDSLVSAASGDMLDDYREALAIVGEFTVGGDSLAGRLRVAMDGLRSMLDGAYRETAMYRTLFERALASVDCAFQVDSGKPSPILPDYCRLGEDKFEAVERLAKDYRELKAENERLRAIVGKLPKTADGIPVTPGMTLYAIHAERYGDEYRIEGDQIDCGEVESIEMDDEHTLVGLGCCEAWLRFAFSTREAAEACLRSFEEL